MQASIVRAHGRQKIEIDGELFEPIAFRSFRPEERNIREFYAAGVRLMSVLSTGQNCVLDVPYSLYGEMWRGIDDYDFSVFDRQMELFMANAPDAYFNIMLQIDTKDWYLQLHPEYSNTFLNLVEMAGCSDWREDAAQFLRAAISYIEEHYGDRVFSYSLFCGGSTEWYTNSQAFGKSDAEIRYHPIKEKAFRQWLGDPGAKLPAMEQLTRSDGAFRHPLKDKAALDYWAFHNKIIGEAVCYFARVAKEAMNRQKLIGLYYGYLNQLSGRRALYEGQLGFEPVWDSPDVDMIFAPAKYESTRMFDGVSGFLHTLDSLKLKGKMNFHEIDHTTYIAPTTVENGRDIPGSGSKLKDAFETRMVLRREFIMCEARRSAMWWFDFFGGYYYAPELMDEVAHIVSVKNRLADVPMESCAQIAVFTDIESQFPVSESTSLAHDTTVSIPDELGRIGAAYDSYTLCDLVSQEFNHQDYKLYIFLNAFRSREEINAKVKALQAAGKSVLWIYAPGYVGEEALSLQAICEQTGMQLEDRTGPDSDVTYRCGETTVSFGFSDLQSPLFEVADAAVTPLAHYTTGEVAVGYREDTHGGKIFYSAVGNLPHQLLRRMAQLAGVHITYDGPDPIYENSALLGIHAQTGGDYCFELGANGRVEELFGQTSYVVEHGRLICHLEKGHSYLFLKDVDL